MQQKRREPTDSEPRTLSARAPVRIDLGGGWTDVPPYSEEEGGFVCNFAINRYARAIVTDIPGRDKNFAAAQEGGESALAMAALRRTRSRYPGAKNVSLVLRSDFPVGAGLGGSSAAGVAALGALLALRGEQIGRSGIAELSRQVEVEDLNVPGGRQDHYAAAYGGALGLTFSTGAVDVNRITLGSSTKAELENRCVLIYTGQSRISGATISAVLNAYRERETRVVTALRRMKELARDMQTALVTGSVDDLADLVDDQWAQQRSLHPLITTPQIDELMESGKRAGARGGKALGASGGGCVLLIAHSGEEERLKNAIAPLGEILSFAIDVEGLAVDG